MKKYNVNKFVYIIMPSIITIIIAVYFIFLYSKSYTYINVLNLAVDAIILICYFRNFCTKISADIQSVDFYTIFKKHRILRRDITYIKCASFLAYIKCDSHSFFVFITRKGKKNFDDIFIEKTKK